MKAIVYIKYGSSDVLQLKEVEKPVPKEMKRFKKEHVCKKAFSVLLKVVVS